VLLQPTVAFSPPLPISLLSLWLPFLADRPWEKAKSNDSESERDINDRDSGIEKRFVVFHNVKEWYVDVLMDDTPRTRRCWWWTEGRRGEQFGVSNGCYMGRGC
jgi:hypothetical protein